jgi:hypothetical protein
LYRPYPNSARTISRNLTLKKELKYLKGENDNRRELGDMLAKLKNFISRYFTITIVYGTEMRIIIRAAG